MQTVPSSKEKGVGRIQTEVTLQKIRGTRYETVDLSTEVNRQIAVFEYQLETRYGLLEANDPRVKLFNQIQAKLNPVMSVEGVETQLYHHPEINAFALRGVQRVGIQLGLLIAMREWAEERGESITEDMCALVLSHEFGHIEQGTEEVGQAANPAESEFEGRARVRNDEFDADRRALAAMAKAGYNPREGLRALQFLRSLGEGISVTSTHPRSSERERELEWPVESPDTFITNIDISPTPLPKAVLDLLVHSADPHPGHKIYDPAHPERIVEAAETASSLHDQLEIVSAAEWHARNRIVKEYADLEVSKRIQAQRLFLWNIKEAIYYFAHEWDIAQDLYDHVLPKPKPSGSLHPVYIQEYAREKDLQEALNWLASIEKSCTSKRHQLHPVDEPPTVLDGSLDEADVAPRRKTQKKATSSKTKPKALTKADQAKIVLLDEQIAFCKHLKEAIPEQLGRIQANHLTTYSEQAVFDPSWKGRKGADKRYLSEHVSSSTPAALVDWATQDGTLFFHKTSIGLSEPLTESVRPVLKEKTGEDRCPRNEAERQTYLEHNRMSGLTSLVFKAEQNRLKDNLHRVRGASTPVLHPELGALQPALSTFLASRYQLPDGTSSELAPRLAQAVSEFHRLSQEEARLLVTGLSADACQHLKRNLQEILVPPSPTADPYTLEKKGIHLLWKEVGDLFYANEDSLLSAIEERLTLSVDTANEELQQLMRLARLSPAKEAFRFQAALLRTIEAGACHTSESLKETLKAVAHTFTPYTREPFAKQVLALVEDRFSAQEVFAAFEALPCEEIVLYYLRLQDELIPFLTPDRHFKLIKAFLVAAPDYSELEHKRDSMGLDLSPDFEEAGLREEDLGETDDHLSKVIYALVDVAQDYYQLLRTRSDQAEQLEDLLRLPRSGFAWENIWSQIDRIWQKLPPDTWASLIERLKAQAFQTKLMGWFDVPSSQGRLLRAVGWKMLGHHNALPNAKVPNQLLNGFDYHPVNPPLHPFNPALRTAKENAALILRYAPDVETRSLLIERLIQAYGLSRESLLTDELAPGGLLAHMAPVANDSYYAELNQKAKELMEKGHIEAVAADYDPKLPSIFNGVKEATIARDDYSRKAILRRLFKDEKSLVEQVGDVPSEQVTRLVALVGEACDFRDQLFQRLEKRLLQQLHITPLADRLSIKRGTLESAAAMTCIDFYRNVIPHCHDLSLQSLWSRRVDRLMQEQALTGKNFSDELVRIEAIYPNASYARDEALLRVGDSTLLERPEDAARLERLLFAEQRPHANKKERKLANQLDALADVLARLNAGQRKDFFLWLCDVDPQPPLLLRAVGGSVKRSIEDIPGALFSATATERRELFSRLLLGEQGLVSHASPEIETAFTQFVDTFTTTLFAKEEVRQLVGTKGANLCQLGLRTALFTYRPVRRAHLVISLIESLKDKQADPASLITSILEVLGPAFIKGAQIVSEEETAGGQSALPAGLVPSLRQMKERVRPFHRLAVIHATEIAGEFKDNGQRPALAGIHKRLATASMKQVYEATDEAGVEVALKVLRPSIRKHLEEDLQVVQAVLAAVNTKVAVPEGLGDKIAEWITSETDFKSEARNQQRLESILDEFSAHERLHHPDRPRVRVAQVKTANSECIRDELIKGSSLETLARQADTQSKVREYSTRAVEALLYQALEKGLFHADPHAGNLFVDQSGDLIFLDTGSVGQFEQAELSTIKRFLRSIFEEDATTARTTLETFIGSETKALDSATSLILRQDLDPTERITEITRLCAGLKSQVHPGFQRLLKMLTASGYLFRQADPLRIMEAMEKHLAA